MIPDFSVTFNFILVTTEYFCAKNSIFNQGNNKNIKMEYLNIGCMVVNNREPIGLSIWIIIKSHFMGFESLNKEINEKG